MTHTYDPLLGLCLDDELLARALLASGMAAADIAARMGITDPGAAEHIAQFKRAPCSISERHCRALIAYDIAATAARHIGKARGSLLPGRYMTPELAEARQELDEARQDYPSNPAPDFDGD